MGRVFKSMGAGRKMLAVLATAVLAWALAPSVAAAAPTQGASASNGTRAVSQYTTGTASTFAGAKKDSQQTLDHNGVYLISVSNGKNWAVVDVAAGSTEAGANVRIYQTNNTLAQYWRAVYKGNGIYNFVCQESNNMLAWQGGAQLRANVATAATGNVNWKVTKNSDGTFCLAPASKTSLRMDVAAGSTANRTNIRLYTRNGTAAQSFCFTKMEGLTQAYAAGKVSNGGFFEIAFASNNGLRVDVLGASTADGANVMIGKDSVSRSQKFRLTYVGNGLYLFQNDRSGKVIDVKGASKSPGANVHQYSKNRTIAQYWYLVRSGSGYSLRSTANALALTADAVEAGKNVKVDTPRSSSAQRFTFIDANGVDDGTYVIQSSIITPMVLDVRAASKASGANVQTYRSNGTDAQKFTITHRGNGNYTIMNVGSGKYLDVKGASKADGANVWQYTYNGSNAQLWKIETNSNGTVRFKSVASGKYLDVSAANPRRGANVQQWMENGSAAQSWVLRSQDWTFYPTSTNLRDLRVLTKAEEYEGWPYKWGGRRPATSFDCAGLVMYCANQAWGTNFDLIYTNAERLYKLCTPISESEARPGDLVFYRGTYGSDVDYISHVVFYAGRGVVYGAGDPIGYSWVDSMRNINGKPAVKLYARIKH